MTSEQFTVVAHLKGQRGGTFLGKLLVAVVDADLENQNKIAKVFPELVAEYRVAWTDHEAYLRRFSS